MTCSISFGGARVPAPRPVSPRLNSSHRLVVRVRLLDLGLVVQNDIQQGVVDFQFFIAFDIAQSRLGFTPQENDRMQLAAGDGRK
jgi:hypothetical protein